MMGIYIQPLNKEISEHPHSLFAALIDTWNDGDGERILEVWAQSWIDVYCVYK